MGQNWKKLFSRVNWQNRPSAATALGATNLNKIDYALDEIDNRVIELNTSKADLEDLRNTELQLSESITEISDGAFDVVNLIKTSSLLDRKYYNPSNGQLLTGDGVKSTELIPIDEHREYYYYTNFASDRETLFSACYFKADKSYNGQQSVVSVRTDPVILIPNDTAFIGITIYNSCVDKCALIDEKYSSEYYVAPQSNENIIPPTKRIKEKAKNETIVSNAQEFIDALALATTKAKKNDWFTIYLEDGEYDLLPYVDLQTDYAIGITIPSYTNVVGKNYLGAKVILDNPSSSKPLSASWLSTLNFGGSGSIENLYVYGNNVRYAVHDDFASADFVRIVKNCRLEHGVNTIATNEDRQCGYGMGLRSGCNALFINTEFIGNSAGLLLHDTANSCSKESNVTFIGCRFVDGSWYADHSKQVRSAYLSGMVGNTSGWKKSNISFENCSFNDPLMHQETIVGIQSLDVSGWGNKESKTIKNEITVKDYFA